MKRIIIFLTVALLTIASAAQAKDWKKIRIGTEGAYPPFNYIGTDGKIVGFDVDIAYALCDYMHAKCTLVAQDWDGIIPALLARKYDAIVASMSITEERKRKVSFTDKYYHTPARMVANKNLIVKILKGDRWKMKIGVQRATIHDRFATDNFGDNIELVRYGTQDEADLDLKAGRVDLLLADSVVLYAGFLKKAGNENYQFIGPEFTDPKWFGPGAGIAVRKQDNDLREQLNAAIKGIRANGTYQKIEAKYFDFDIYGE